MRRSKKCVITLSLIFSATILNAFSNTFNVNASNDDDPRKTIERSAESESNNKVKQRFNPIFGDEKESNQIISFIASNLVVELDPEQIKKLDGFMVASFVIDTLGNIEKLAVQRSYNTWVDYAIIGAIKSLPPWGKPSLDKNDKPVEKYHNIVFTFGSYVKGDTHFGFQADAVRDNTQKEINSQRDALSASLNEKRTKWNSFTDVNSKLVYDIKQGLKNEATIINPNDPFTNKGTPPITVPTIKITEKE